MNNEYNFINDLEIKDIENYLSINSQDFLNILSQINIIINNSKSASKLARGIILEVLDSSHVKVIYPNELYYFTADLDCITTLENGTQIYLNYLFLTKLTKYYGNSFYIFRFNDKYYLNLETGNLELLNPELLESEKEKIKNNYEIKGFYNSYKVGDMYNKLKSLQAITCFEVEENRKFLNSNDNTITFKSPLLMAKSEFLFLNTVIDYKLLNYLIYICSLSLADEDIEIYNVDYKIIPKYAIKYKNTYLISNYPESSKNIKVNDLFAELPKFTIIDYANLKYKLEYADSIIYAKGVVTFINKEGKLVGKIKLNNNSDSEIEIPTLSELYLKQNQQIKVNYKTLLTALSALDSSLETFFGLKDGLLYIINSDISLALTTF